MASYRLGEERWIPVETLDGVTRSASLTELFELSARFRRLLGNPLEVAVLTRLALAVMHVVDTPSGSTDWLRIWGSRRSLMERCAQYVRQYSAAFDLYAVERPFLQHPGITEVRGSPALLVYDMAQGNNPVFLDASLVSDPVPIPSDQAARALLVCHAFGGSGTGGNNPLNGGKKDTMYAGPLCARLVALLEGGDLEKTLALNLAAASRTGRPAWARDLPKPASQTPSEGVADLYTRQTRLARLAPTDDGRQCKAVALFMGEAVVSDEELGIDPMVPRYLATDGKFKALRLDPDRALWRSADVFLCTKESKGHKPVRCLQQLTPLIAQGSIPEDEPVSMRLVGVAANAQGPVTELWRDDSLPFSLSIAADDRFYELLKQRIGQADQTAKNLRNNLFGFAKRYLSETAGATDPKDAWRLVDELSPSNHDYWKSLAPLGERLALPNTGAKWEEVVSASRKAAWRSAIDRLPADARRLKAEYFREAKAENAAHDQKGGKKTA